MPKGTGLNVLATMGEAWIGGRAFASQAKAAAQAVHAKDITKATGLNQLLFSKYTQRGAMKGAMYGAGASVGLQLLNNVRYGDSVTYGLGGAAIRGSLVGGAFGGLRGFGKANSAYERNAPRRAAVAHARQTQALTNATFFPALSRP